MLFSLGNVSKKWLLAQGMNEAYHKCEAVEIRRQSLEFGFQRCVSVWVWKSQVVWLFLCVCCVLCPGSGQRAKQYLGFLVACELKNNLHGAISFKSGESMTEPRAGALGQGRPHSPLFSPGQTWNTRLICVQQHHLKGLFTK